MSRSTGLAPKIEKKTYKVLCAYGIEGRHGTDTYEIRMYDDSDPRGKYQKWVDRKFYEKMSEEEASAPSPRNAEWTMSEEELKTWNAEWTLSEEVKALTLHSRLAELKLLSM